ncbi:hypothetical protein GCM10029992_50800 [Glycomyces albus]
MDVPELDRLLRHRPESPLEQRTEAITEQLATLRESLRTAPATELHGQVAASVAAAFKLPDAHAVALIDRLRADQALWTVLLDPDLTAQDATGEYVHEITEAGFGALYEAWRLLHKAAAVVRRAPVESAELGWLLDRADTHGMLHLGELPVAAADPDADLDRWRALSGWLDLFARYPAPRRRAGPRSSTLRRTLHRWRTCVPWSRT